MMATAFASQTPSLSTQRPASTQRFAFSSNIWSPKNHARFRLEFVLFVVFVMCFVQFLWLTTLLQKPEAADAAVVASAALSSIRTGNWSRFKYKQPPSDRNVGRRKTGKHKRRRDRLETRKERWDPGVGLKEEPVPLKISLPVFVASLPKSGTTSIWQYFQCGGWHARHQWTKLESENRTELIGKCVYTNMQRQRPPFEGCGSNIYTDTGYARFPKQVKTGPSCYYPSISALEAIYEHYPNATIILVVRETSSWSDSILQWGNGTLIQRWGDCDPQHRLPTSSSKQELDSFYDWHNDHVRQFARRRNMRYIEVTLEDLETGMILEEEIGIPASCWGKCTPKSKFCQHLR